MRTILLTSAIWLLATAAWGQSDLTPSVNYFSYDYGAVPTSDAVDSIIAWRYDALVADISFGSGYGTKYSEYYAHDPSTQFYVYVDGMNNWTSTGALGPVIEAITPYLPGQDSTLAFYHTEDAVDYDSGAASCGGPWTATRTAYDTDEFHSRLLTYTGCVPRAITKWSAPGYPTAFANYYAAPLKAKHDTASWTLAGIWFDNRAIPQSGGLQCCQECSPYPLLHETNLGGDAVGWGCEGQRDGNRTYHTQFLNVELIQYTKIMADTIAAITGLKTTVNAVGFSDSDEGVFFHGRHHAYYVADNQGVDRSQEFTGSTVRNGMFSPGPTNGATSIDSATVCAVLSPIDIYTEVKVLDADGIGEWFNPIPGSYIHRYSTRDHHYFDLSLYYLWRGKYTMFNIAEDPADGGGELNWLDGGGSGGRCVHAGMDDDSCYWIGAIGTRVGRDGYDDGWSTDTVRFYAASVTCADCIGPESVGKDSEGQNWVVFSRQWTGDDDYKYLVLLRPTANNQHVWGVSTESGSVDLPAGDWNKMDEDGSWGGDITSDTYMNGEGGIYRQLVEAGTTLKLGATYLKAGKIGE